MSAGGSAAGSGLVVGLCLAFLGQQFGFFDLSSLVTGLIYLIAFAVVFAVVFGLLGMWIGARYLRKHTSLTPWKEKAAAPAESSSTGPPSTDTETK